MPRKDVSDLEIPLDHNYPVIEYKDRTPKYGWSSFQFCVKRTEEGIIEKIFITPRQQGRLDKIYVYDPKNDHREFRPASWNHRPGISSPVTTVQFWCHDHKSTSIVVNVPLNTRLLRIVEYMSTGIWAYFQKKDVFQQTK